MSPSGPLAVYAQFWFAYFGAMGLFNPYAPLWFQSLGLSTFAIGALASLQAWTRVVAPYGWSWLADRSGQRVKLIGRACALALMAAAALALLPVLLPLLARQLPAAALPWCLALLVGVLFLSNGGLTPLAEAALAQRISRDGAVDAARYGRVRLWGSLGFLAVVAIGGALFQGIGIGAFGLLLVLLNAMMLWAARKLPADADDLAVPGEARAPAPPIGPRLKAPVLRWFFASVALTVLAHVSLYAFFSLYLVGQGLDKATLAGLWIVPVVCEIAFFYFQGRWLLRVGLLRWLALAAGLSALRFALTPLVGASVVLLALLQSLHAVTFAAHHAACIALITRWFPGRLRVRGQALYSALGYGVPGVVGGLAGGWMFEALGPASVFHAAAVAALLALAFVARMAKLGLASGDPV